MFGGDVLLVWLASAYNSTITRSIVLSRRSRARIIYRRDGAVLRLFTPFEGVFDGDGINSHRPWIATLEEAMMANHNRATKGSH